MKWILLFIYYLRRTFTTLWVIEGTQKKNQENELTLKVAAGYWVQDPNKTLHADCKAKHIIKHLTHQIPINSTWAALNHA